MDYKIKITPPNVEHFKLQEETHLTLYDEALFEYKHIRDYQFSDISCRLLKFDYCILENVVFEQCTLEKFEAINCVFVNCDFANSIFNESIFSKVEFKNCRITGVQFPDSTFSDFLFSGCQGSFMTSRYSSFKHGEFVECKLNLSDFSASDLDKISFSKCDLKESTFANCSFNLASLATSDIERASFNANNLKGLTISLEQSYIFARLLGLNII